MADYVLMHIEMSQINGYYSFLRDRIVNYPFGNINDVFYIYSTLKNIVFRLSSYVVVLRPSLPHPSFFHASRKRKQDTHAVDFFGQTN